VRVGSAAIDDGPASRSRRAARSARPPSGSTTAARRAPLLDERLDGKGERIGGEITAGEIPRQRRRPEIRHVDLDRAPVDLEHGPAGAAGRVQLDVRSAGVLGQRAGERAPADGNGQVDVSAAPPEERIADRAAHQVDVVPAGALTEEAQDRRRGRREPGQSNAPRDFHPCASLPP
jgi:hypothetical protein